MEIFVRNVDFFTSQHDVVRHLATYLHVPPYTTGAPVNFHVRMFKPRRKGDRHLHKGSGVLTVPTEDVGRLFLAQYGEPRPRSFITIRGRRLAFKLSDRPVSQDVLLSIRHSPYLDPAELEERERIAQKLESSPMLLSHLQFGWDCRDHVFSVEWDYPCVSGSKLQFDAENRRLSLQLASIQRASTINGIFGSIIEDAFPISPQEVLINFSTIDYITRYESDGDPIILLYLSTPPLFIQAQQPFLDRDVPSLRYAHLNLSDIDGRPHSDISPYLSLMIRLVCSRSSNLARFDDLAAEAGLYLEIQREYYPVEGLYLEITSSKCNEDLVLYRGKARGTA